MIKRIYFPTVMISPRHLHQWAKDGDKEAQERIDKKSAEFNERIRLAEIELDEAFNDGFDTRAQYDSKGEWEEGVTLILHKRDEEVELTAASTSKRFVLKPKPKAERDATITRLMAGYGLPDSEAQDLIRKMDATFDDESDNPN